MPAPTLGPDRRGAAPVPSQVSAGTPRGQPPSGIGGPLFRLIVGVDLSRGLGQRCWRTARRAGQAVLAVPATTRRDGDTESLARTYPRRHQDAAVAGRALP